MQRVAQSGAGPVQQITPVRRSTRRSVPIRRPKRPHIPQTIRCSKTNGIHQACNCALLLLPPSMLKIGAELQSHHLGGRVHGW